MKRVTILLADDHAVVIEGLRRILDRPEFEIVGAVNDGRALVQAAAESTPDVIIADVAMPSLNGIEAARQIRKHKPNVKIIFPDHASGGVYARQAMDAGASGVCPEECGRGGTDHRHSEVLDGRAYVAKSIAEPVKLALEAAPEPPQDADGLTARQREVLQLLAEGRQAKEIAVTTCPTEPWNFTSTASWRYSGSAAWPNWPVTRPSTESSNKRPSRAADRCAEPESNLAIFPVDHQIARD